MPLEKLFKNVYKNNSNGSIYSEIIINTLITEVSFFEKVNCFPIFLQKSPRTNIVSAPKRNLFDTFFIYTFNGAFFVWLKALSNDFSRGLAVNSLVT